MPLKTTAAGAGDTPPEFDFTIATSERFALILEQSFQVGRESVELVGLPRNDSLKVGNDSPSKFIVMMPTWRTSIYGTTNIHAGDPGAWAMDKEQVGELNGVLHAHGYKALIKPHPMSDPLELSHWESEHISVIDNRWLLDRDISLYELISDSALLVTDYSSIAVDYVITGRPICLLQSDLSDYQATRGLNFSYDEMSQLGHLAREWSEFLKFLEESLIGDSNGMINSSSLFYEVLPSNASVSVLNLMMRRLEEKMAGNKVSACTR
jgi:CDP-glycerol glycerophosphotransferase (TagB/SpsB family)